jgi:probable phosphoglycerate mutase
MRLIITRHGETLENIKGILQGQLQGTLSKNGIQQSKKLANRLKDEKIDYIFSSDLKRAVDTTKEIIKYHLNSKLFYVKELREKHLGEFQGKTREEVNWNSKTLTAPKEPKESESMEVFLQRVESFLDSVIENHYKDSVLLVCHGGVTKVLIAHILGKNLSDIKRIKNTSITIFEIEKDREPKLILFNSTEHL